MQLLPRSTLVLGSFEETRQAVSLTNCGRNGPFAALVKDFNYHSYSVLMKAMHVTCCIQPNVVSITYRHFQSLSFL